MKDIPPLSSLAEVETLSGSCTLSGHFFADIRQPGKILVREVACLNCPECVQLNFERCKKLDMCGMPTTRDIVLASGGRSEVAETRDAVKKNGYVRAKTVRKGMFVGSENTQEKEPYIISIAMSSEKRWTGPPGKSWMGRIVEGDLYIEARKLHKASAFVYTETDIIFYLNSEDVRIPDMCYLSVEHELRTSSRVTLSRDKRYKFEEEQVELLKRRVCMEPDE